jgi:hypothetical protein
VRLITEFMNDMSAKQEIHDHASVLSDSVSDLMIVWCVRHPANLRTVRSGVPSELVASLRMRLLFE